MRRTNVNAYFKLYYHLTWSTKDRHPLLDEEVGKPLLEHLKRKCQDLNLVPVAVNAASDHVHLLISAGPSHRILQIVRALKGSSSYFISHTTSLTNFRWQEGYSVHTVNPDGIKVVSRYIRFQEKHHREDTLMPDLERMKER